MADQIVNGMHGCSAEEDYVVPSDPLIRERLEWFQDQKLALMMHFGIYNQMGICESWPLSDEDAVWSRRQIDFEDDPEKFKELYINMNKSFNPVRLQPEEWAKFAKRNGFKYYILTTKHHDGFCLFDTKYTDYKVTDPSCPFHTHKYADIVKHVFDAFRKEGIAIAPYFSKPDWNCPWYWAKGMEKPFAFDRNPTYDPKEHPELWEKYVEFTHNQMMELCTNYGRIEILWLDGGQVAPQNNQDIRLSEFVEKARKVQPWLLTADRTVGGENENYITPEQSVPSSKICVPWESCVTAGEAFAYSFDDEFKSPRALVHLLINVVCRGGNLALNISPQPDGRLPKGAMEAVNELGDWLQANGEGIYKTRMYETNEIGKTAYTKTKEAVYALYRMEENEVLSNTMFIPFDKKVAHVSYLEGNIELTFTQFDQGVLVTLPQNLVGTCPYAPVFKLK